MTDPMGLKELQDEHQMVAPDQIWKRAKYFDSSNNKQISFEQFTGRDSDLRMAQVEMRTRNMPTVATVATVELEHTFDVSSSQLYANGMVKADAVTARDLKPPQVTISPDGTIDYIQRVVAKTTFKVGLSQERVNSEWERVESLQHEVHALNSLARLLARPGFPSAEAAKATIGGALRRDFAEYTAWEAFYFEVFRGGK